MPELPEVEVVRRSLEPQLRGSRIIRVLAGQHPADILALPLGEFAREVEGQRIAQLGRRGKTLLIELDSGATVTVHLGMTGELSLAQPGEPHPPHHHLSLVLDQGQEVRYRDIRRFGRIGLLRPGERDRLEARLGPEPLSPELTPVLLHERLARHRRAIKALLLEQSFLAGVGNIYADEALFRAGINPLRPASSLDLEETRGLLHALREVLAAAITRRGTTIRNYRDGLGQPGENQTRLQIYGRPPGSPCPVCGAPVERVVVAQRGTTFCPRCQPFLPATAASRSSTPGSSGSSTG
ncbi:bifunctional DNA-formamidopyrimidine glycosylase/DNA-(apurinic or apyrimidinic site) lyase [Thermomicrobiaceae bacterium CFH 74404]|uniref:Formamidopyrimidine-DNA glycosylase n=1 Tax=Thermalbibacter longus TaxID=2951981 RepID=A0AA41WD95_9BACT|nr:bifunctional DNA-formamidopyrimidine glycosylase/DNA-(apurinic or apyrimidinic site) lyase [Thermalbibacter longus]MCM8748210.1 bifunctional DNA-formamidopyrimidine glycosylase/DNA-(apurinic or apyrimidinic site) lyase [Thermalbibacter longus]